jgi:hypothetical protein
LLTIYHRLPYAKVMSPTQKRHVTKSLPAPYMRIEEDTDDAKWSVACYGISKDCIADDSDARINGNGYMYGGDAFVSVRLDYPAGEPKEQNFTCSYNDQIVLTRRKQDMGVVNMCGRTAYEVTVESNVVTARYDCLPRSVSVDGVTCLVWQDRVEKIRTINGATTTDEREKVEEDGTYCLLNKDRNELKVVFAQRAITCTNDTVNVIVQRDNSIHKDHSATVYSFVANCSAVTQCVPPPVNYSPRTVVYVETGRHCLRGMSMAVRNQAMRRRTRQRPHVNDNKPIHGRYTRVYRIRTTDKCK